MFALGSFYAALVRWNLLVPDGSHMSAETYNKAFTGHGVIMVFFFLIPSIPATLGNFLIPLMIGAKDLAFPRINLAELVHLRDRRRRSRCTRSSPAGSTPAGPSTRPTARSSPRATW